MLTAAARTLSDHAIGEHQQTYSMAELEQRVTHRCRRAQGSVPLACAVYGHGRAGVEQNGPVGHGLGFESANGRSATPCGLPPVDVTHFVAGDIIAMIKVLNADTGRASDDPRSRCPRTSLG